MLDIPASEIQTGDFIPGLGDAYVFEVEHDQGVNSFSTRGYDTYLGDNWTVVTFHDAQGEENYMILNPECRVEVQR